MTIELIACVVLAYLIGSIPFGVLIARARGVDILKVGSGNIGATNVFRTLGKGPGAIVFLLDVLKGYAPAGFTSYYFQDRSVAFGIGVVAVLGHSFSPWLKFKGGKGVATGLGAMLGSIPAVAGSTLGVFLIFLFVTGFLSVGSLASAVSLPVWGIVYREPVPILVGCFVLAILVWVRHWPNIQRLRNGTESKFDIRGASSPKSTPADPSLSCDDRACEDSRGGGTDGGGETEEKVDSEEKQGGNP